MEMLAEVARSSETIFFHSFVKKRNGELMECANGDSLLCRVTQGDETKIMELPKSTLLGMGLLENNENNMNAPNKEGTSSNNWTTPFPATSSFSSAITEEPKKKDIEWNPPETRLLLDLYYKYMKEVGPMKKFRIKKNMWEQISRDINSLEYTAAQCDNRYKTVLKRKRDSNKHNRVTGVERESVEYEEEVERIAAIDDSIEPEIMRGVNKVVTKRASTPTNTPSISKKKKCSVEQVLQFLAAKEESRQQREKMEILRQLLKDS